MSSNGPILTAIGGGTGPLPILAAFKRLTNHISAIIAMWDSGGSSGILRDEYGTLPPGDLRQALLALMADDDASLLFRQFLSYRPIDGPFAGHPAGNMLVTLLENFLGSHHGKTPSESIDLLSRFFNITGRVIPVSDTKTDLYLELPDGKLVKGEDDIGENCAGMGYFQKGLRPNLFLDPTAKVSEAAIEGIETADMVVLCPGKLYTSVGPHMLFAGLVEVLLRHPNVVYFANLMTHPGQTDSFGPTDCADALHALAGAEFINTVVCNTQAPGSELLDRYAREGEEPMVYCERAFRGKPYRALGLPLVSRQLFIPQAADSLARTLIRHDSEQVFKAINHLLLARVAA